MPNVGVETNPKNGVINPMIGIAINEMKEECLNFPLMIRPRNIVMKPTMAPVVPP